MRDTDRSRACSCLRPNRCPGSSAPYSRLHRQRNPADHERDALADRGDALVGEAMLVDEGARALAEGDYAAADLIGYHQELRHRFVNCLQELLALGVDLTEAQIRQPKREAVDDEAVPCFCFAS